MKGNIRKRLSFLLVFILIFNIILPVQVSATTEKKGSDDISRGQVCQVVNQLLGASVKSGEMEQIVNYKKKDAYYNIMSIAYHAGYITANGNKLCNANSKATYNFVANIFSKVMKISKKQALRTHKASDKLSSKELTSYINELLPNILTKNISNKDLKGNVIISKPNIKLTNITIDGNLIIGDGVADQEVILDNTVVKGTLVVRGGGENSIKIVGSSSISTVIIEQLNNRVSIKVSDDAQVKIIYINDGSNDVSLFGSFGTVNVVGESINVSTYNSKISSVTLTGENTSLSVSTDTVVKQVTLAETAKSARLEVLGTVSDVSTNASNSTIKLNDNGAISSLTVGDLAKGSAINVIGNANIALIVSDAQNTIITGDGKVSKATLNGNDSKITTPGTIVIVGENTTGIQRQDPTTPQIPGTGSGSPSGPSSVTNDNPSPTPTTTPSPSPTPTVTPGSELYENDSRFATGYPIIETTINSNGNRDYVLKLKLKDNFTTSQWGGSVYYVASIYKNDIEVSSDAVIHGHLGVDVQKGSKTYHQQVQADREGVQDILDSSEFTIPMWSDIPAKYDVKFYFVIETLEKTSTRPTRIVIPGGDDSVAPNIKFALWSDESSVVSGTSVRTVRMFPDEPIDTAQTVDKSAFTANGVTGASITCVSLNKNATDTWIDLTLSYPTGSILDDLSITYTPPKTGGITDVALIPAKDFTIYRSPYEKRIIVDATPTFQSFNVSNDGKYIALELGPRVLNDNLAVKVNGESWTITDVDGPSYKCTIRCTNPSATLASSYDIELSTKDTSKLVDIMGQEYDHLNYKVSSVSGASITCTDAKLKLDGPEPILTLTFDALNANPDDLSFGCQYLLNVNGQVIYRLRACGDLEEVNGNFITISFKAGTMFEVDFTKITKSSHQVTISYSPLTTDPDSLLLRDASGKVVEPFSNEVTIEGL